jgi:hypothetical protein
MKASLGPPLIWTLATFPLQEIVLGKNLDRIYIVFEYVEHDLKELMETMKQPFLQGENTLA